MFQSFELANRYGLQTCAPVVIGVPFETPEMLEDSIKTVAQLHATEYGCNIFYPYRGTPLRTVCEENGFMPDILGTEANDVDRELIWERKESILNLPTLTKDEILHYNQNWTDLVTRQMPWSNRMAYGIRRKYGKFFHVDKKLPKVKAFLDNNKYAHGSRRLVAKTLGF